jgi:hypothetical protein
MFAKSLSRAQVLNGSSFFHALIFNHDFIL